MRRVPTAAERKPWTALRRHQLGVQFRRQYPINNHIADFAAPSINLIIEIDGDTHTDPVNQARDVVRTDQLIALGYRVIRFTNRDVLTNLTTVLNCIRDSIPNPP